MRMILNAMLACSIAMTQAPIPTESEPVEIREENPLYEEAETDIIPAKENHSRALTAEGFAVSPNEASLVTADEVFTYAREELVKRTTPIVIQTIYAGADKDFVNTIMQEAMAHTGKPKEGDYLRYQWKEWKCDAYRISYGWHYSIDVAYYTDARQEASVDSSVKQLLSRLDLSRKTDYQKIKGVYDWIVQNVSYASEKEKGVNYSAYGALNNRSAFCQGYAVLFYRLMLELGIDCRVVSGQGSNELHAWNIVKLNGKYYNIDTTWASTTGNPSAYFLKGSADFPDHQASPEYLESSFTKKYQISASDYQVRTSDEPDTKITLSQTEITLREEEQTWLKAAVEPADAANRSIIWSSSAPSVASVDKNGMVTAVSPGTAVITAVSEDTGVSAQCRVTVLNAEQTDGTLAMYRLYNPNSGEHHYTSDRKERTALDQLGWNYEGIGWYAPKTSSVPVYRLYNRNEGEHHYTLSVKEKDALIVYGWDYEGIGWYSSTSQKTPLYRVYNPNKYSNNHHYTTSAREKDVLIRYGWRDEGIGWYGE